jgi:hypothetical protein
MNVSKRLLLVASFLLATEAIAATPPMVVQPMAVPATNPWLVPYVTPAYQAPMPPVFMPFPLPGLPQAGPAQPSKPYTMRRIIPQQEKTQMMQMFLPMMTNMFRMSMPDSMNYFSRKYKVKPGLSFDEVRDSLFLRGNQLNVKKVGENLMWKDFQVVLNDNESPRIEVYSFCDIAVARDLLKISPEFIVFLPCRIAIMEDGNKEIWVLMLDWNMDWVRGYEKQMGLTDELIKKATDLNQRLDEMMRAAANGDL